MAIPLPISFLVGKYLFQNVKFIGVSELYEEFCRYSDVWVLMFLMYDADAVVKFKGCSIIVFDRGSI